MLAARRRGGSDLPDVLVATPVKDATPYLDAYEGALGRLDYPRERLSLGLLESDSADGTFAELERRRGRLERRCARVGLWQHDFAYRIPAGLPRWAEEIQPERRSVLARSRNYLLARALRDEAWVLWLDVDVIDYPPDVLRRLLATGKDIVQPNCVLLPGGSSFDHNAWRDHGRLHLDDLRAEGDLVPLHAVGGTMLLVRADLHREGLVFPPVPFGEGTPLARPGRGEVETEGLGILAHAMGYSCWGMPNLEIRHVFRSHG